MSKLQVDDIVNKGDNGAPGFSKGVVVTGVCTATSFSGSVDATGLTGTPDIVVRNITGVGMTLSGTLNYEDVTNVEIIQRYQVNMVFMLKKHIQIIEVQMNNQTFLVQ